MTETRVALITGITGQDGSYLTDLLLDKGYEVHGVHRRHSNAPAKNIQHLDGDAVHFHKADLTDYYSIERVVGQVQPDEVYHLGAQSRVGHSFNVPFETLDTNVLGTMRLLKSVENHAPSARVYNAASSEMYGNQPANQPLDEEDPLQPVSPYAVSKVAAYHAAQVARDAHDLFVSNGILFNHECFLPETPLIVHDGDYIDCLPIADLFSSPAHNRQQDLDVNVWDKGGWTPVTLGTATWHSPSDPARIRSTRVRCGELRTTHDHEFVLSTGDSIPAKDLQKGDAMMGTALPSPPGTTTVNPDLARLLGYLVADGHVTYSKGSYGTTLTKDDADVRDTVQRLWERVFAGSVSDRTTHGEYSDGPVKGLNLHSVSQGIHQWLFDLLYTDDRHKRVPRIILNADAETWHAFLEAYNHGDGLKAGHGRYEFKNFRTSSPTLAASLWWMASHALDQRMVLNLESTTKDNTWYRYWSINLNSPTDNDKGAHFQKPQNEVKSFYDDEYAGWTYDVATETGTLHAGVGDLIVHNSPRRGTGFVTRKITSTLARIKHGDADEIRLGNLSPRRDWGHARDYVHAMWMMLQQPDPDDYVVATGAAWTVREFLNSAYQVSCIDTPLSDLLVIDDRFYRPADIEVLQGDATKAREVLGWSPDTHFHGLVHEMMTRDLERAKQGDL